MAATLPRGASSATTFRRTEFVVLVPNPLHAQPTSCESASGLMFRFASSSGARRRRPRSPRSGVDVFKGDLEVPASIEAAMRGVSSVVFVTPPPTPPGSRPRPTLAGGLSLCRRRLRDYPPRTHCRSQGRRNRNPASRQQRSHGPAVHTGRNHRQCQPADQQKASALVPKPAVFGKGPRQLQRATSSRHPHLSETPASTNQRPCRPPRRAAPSVLL